MPLSTLILTCLATAIVVGVVVGVVVKQRLQKKINYMLDALEDKELNFRFNEQGIRNRSFNKTLNRLDTDWWDIINSVKAIAAKHEANK